MNLEAARARFGDQVDRVGAFLWQGDELADRVVETFATLSPGEGMALLDRGLAEGLSSVPEAPEPLRELLREVSQVPAWVSENALERGGELLFRAGWFGGLALGLSLLIGYASPGGNKPLAMSGRLSEQAPRRLTETSRFVQATCAPWGLSPGGEGVRIAVRVRLMHAQVRRMIMRSGRWDSEAWGLPINQHDMAGTSLLFSLAPIESLRTLGFSFDAEEVHLYMQLFRYSGHLMGVTPELLPTSEMEGHQLKDIITATEGPPDDDSRRLARALFEAGPRKHGKTAEIRARAERIARVGEGVIRGVIGDEMADGLAIPKTPYRHVIHPIRGAISQLERSQLVKKSLRTKAISLGQKYWETAITRGVGPIVFSLPEELLGAASHLL